MVAECILKRLAKMIGVGSYVSPQIDETVVQNGCSNVGISIKISNWFHTFSTCYVEQTVNPPPRLVSVIFELFILQLQSFLSLYYTSSLCSLPQLSQQL